MATYRQALNLLNQMEQVWFQKLGAHFGVPLPVPPAPLTPGPAIPRPVPTMTNGEVQFVSIEYVKRGFEPKGESFSIEQAFANVGEDPAASRDKPVPLIAAVGINYDQN